MQSSHLLLVLHDQADMPLANRIAAVDQRNIAWIVQLARYGRHV